MSLIKTTSLALMMSAATVSGAFAADLISYPTSTAEPVAIANDPGFDWTGFYAGVFGSVQDYANTWEYGLGVDLGANVQFEYFLLGGEVAFEGLTDGNGGGRGYAQGLARAGIVVTDPLLIYAAGGYGGDLNSGDRHWLAGGGIEYAVTDDISVRGQYLHGFAANGGNDTDQFTVGANWHF